MVGLQKEDCRRLRKVKEWNYLHTLTFREAVPFALVGKLISDKQASQKMEEKEVKEETKMGRGGCRYGERE